MENNQIELIGKIKGEPIYSHTMYNSDFYSLQIEVTRSSGTIDELKLIYNSDIFDIEDIDGKFVSVIGEIRTRNIQDNNTTHLDIFVYVLDISLLDLSGDVIGSNFGLLQGYIVKKNNCRTTPGGRTICDVILACNRRYNKTSYIPIVVWGINAKKVEKLNIGDEIKINGRLQSREYYKQSEDKIHRIYEFSVQTIE